MRVRRHVRARTEQVAPLVCGGDGVDVLRGDEEDFLHDVVDVRVANAEPLHDAPDERLVLANELLAARSARRRRGLLLGAP